MTPTTAGSDTMAKKKPRKLKLGSHYKAQPRAEVSLAQPWDMGAMGPANRHGLEIEDASEPDADGKRSNPNGVRRARRVDLLEFWHRRGTITAGGFNAAEKLRNAFEATQRAPGWPDNDRVQSSRKPDHAVTITVDRISAFHAVNRLVPKEDRAIIDCCVLMGRTPADLPRYRNMHYAAGLVHLREALDRLHARMG